LGTEYWFALKTSDEVLNESTLSNVPSGNTTAAPTITVNVQYPDAGGPVTPDTAVLYLWTTDWTEVARIGPTSNVYTFSNLAPGEYMTEAYQDNMLIGTSSSVVVDYGDSPTVNVTTLYQRNLLVTVYYSNGATPIEGANVTIRSWNSETGDWESEYVNTTISDGTVTFPVWPTSQPGERYRIEVTHDTYASTEDPVYVDVDTGGSYSVVLDEPVP
jgi:hypothetical protein